MTRLLLTYFDAFEGVPVNPTDLVAHRVRELLAESAPQTEVLVQKLPVTFGESGQVLAQALEEHRPDVVIATGVAVGRDRVSLERVAVNLDDARIQDNLGRYRIDTEIVAGGPAAYFSTLPTRAAFDRVQGEGLPVELSYTAGTYVCNHIFYTLMHLLAASGQPAGFVHIPAVTEVPESYAAQGQKDAGGREGAAPHLPLAQVARVLELIALETLAQR